MFDYHSMALYDLNYGPDYVVVLVDEVAGQLGLGAADDVYPDLPAIFSNTPRKVNFSQNFVTIGVTRLVVIIIDLIICKSFGRL